VQQCIGIAYLVGDVEAQPNQRHRHQNHPAEREQTGGERGIAIQPTGQHAHDRPAGECQNGSPEQRGSKGRQYPETGGQQPEEQNLHQQAIIVEHAKLLY